MATKTASKVKLAPLGDRVVIRQIKHEEILASGILIPDTAAEKPQQGEVVAIGPGRFEEGKRIPVDCKVGDKIFYAKYSGNEIKIDNEEYVVLKESEVLAVFVD